MLLNISAWPVPGPCASRMMVPSSMFQSTSALISCSSPCARSASIQPRMSPNAIGVRSTARSSFRVWNMSEILIGSCYFVFTRNRSVGGAISVTRSRTSALLDSGASVISRGSSRAVQA